MYAENAPAPDGQVYCGGADWAEGDDGCGRAFPGLARLIESGAPRYPKYCRECREELAAEAAEFRKLDATVGVGAVVGNGDPRPAPDPLAERGRGRPRPPLQPASDTEGERELNWARGGFAPRPIGPDVVESELGDGQAEWPGFRIHPL